MRTPFLKMGQKSRGSVEARGVVVVKVGISLVILLLLLPIEARSWSNSYNYDYSYNNSYSGGEYLPLPPGVRFVYTPMGQMTFINPVAVSNYYNWRGAQPMGISYMPSYLPPMGMDAITNSAEFDQFVQNFM